MAPISKKRKPGRRYYAAVESARIDGQPRSVWQKYLGRVEEMLKARTDATTPAPQTLPLFAFGPVAFWEIAQQLVLLVVLTQQVPKREQGPSVGPYLLLAAITRARAPRSKRQMREWYASTALARLGRFPPEDFRRQHLGDHLSLLDEGPIAASEAKSDGRLLSAFSIPWQSLVYDTTTFFTSMHSAHTRPTLAQRGWSKATRHDRRQIGLALVVSREG
jgi:hypothetical protein